MYKPYGENIRCYDVNSLYPYIMKRSKFPVGIIRKFIGDITILNKNDYYWFGDCDISTKKDLYQPYLQLHVDTKNGMRTISPNGSFNMILNSCEYYNSLKDYNIKINHGYFFDSKNIFNEFVDDLYNLRLKYPKTDPMNMTCKLIMNSLYGRFAMKPIYTDQVFVNKNIFLKLAEKYEIIDFLDLKDDEFFCPFINPDNLDKELKISIGIASAVTAYSRVYISQFKNNLKYNLYYTDTDSIFIDSDLEDKFINNEIGNFKLEYIFKEGIFLGPKIYAGITNDNKYICKIKGYKNPKDISFNDLKSLFNKNNKLNLSHKKWFKSLINSNIIIKDQLYTLIAKDNKRDFIYENNKLLDTKSYIVKNEIINNININTIENFSIKNKNLI
jgi:hypothetical protein